MKRYNCLKIFYFFTKNLGKKLNLLKMFINFKPYILKKNVFKTEVGFMFVNSDK